MRRLGEFFAWVLRTALAAPLLVSASASWSESNLVLPYPTQLGSTPAATYDDDGQRVGGARLSLTRAEDGTMRLDALTGVDDGARTQAEAIFEIIDDDRGLRLLREQSRSHDDQGQPLGTLTIDHEKGVGSCSPPPAVGGQTVTVKLEEDERIANVPLNLLFLPLVQGRVDHIDFQYFLCRFGVRVLDFRATRDADPVARGGRSIVRVTYGPYLGEVASWLGSKLIPKLAFWFEANDGGTYLAHRMPLFSKGPEVMVVRDGMSPTALP